MSFKEEELKELRISIDKEIQNMLTFIKDFHCIKTSSDMIRYLIAKEYREAQKISKDLEM